MFKNLKKFAQKRSEFGSQKYRIDNPAYLDGKTPDADNMPLWGNEPTIELFWFRNLPEDMREELADAQVYSERFIVRERVVDIPDPVRTRLEDLTAQYESALEFAYELTLMMSTVLEEHAPELLEDQEEMWGKFSPRLTFPAE